ncbi:ABC transporter substrate-binding protein [Marinimicrobium sp. ABcell2]|uniref:substrate-binding periplasmic protein n=1 Tax=Marinimicrobium sp. ABcell2 TaxID=3069751 RepID=UPI0027B48028|nr:transporter substrate-binding domain-containing protein [Marinimicrobium sp. ABcell2]MDQ2075981.1 transporter substrate-binding domain-containing protein [Marinimicrobium sp. ABcell2]
MERLLWLCVILPVLAGAGAAVASPSEVRLGTNVSPSPTRPGETTKSGSIDHVECISERLDIPFQIMNMPWRRARQEVFGGDLDGFFTAMMRGRGTDARLSAPLVLENWYWFWRKNDSPPGDPGFRGRVGVILGSHQSDWFEQTGFEVSQRVNTMEQLLKLVLSGRIDAFIAYKDQFEEALNRLDADEDFFSRRFFRYMPLSVYFGPSFLEANPGFMTEFNRHVFNCAPEGFSLSKEEQNVIAERVAPTLNRWARSSGVHAALEEYNRLNQELEAADIRARERQWQEAFKARQYDVVDHWLHSELSKIFANWIADSEGITIEVVLMDARGFTVAASPMPAEYWQGGEARYERVLGRDAGELVFDDVRFYRSTERFKAHVGMPVIHPDTQEQLGVVSVGVNVEEALFNDWSNR